MKIEFLSYLAKMMGSRFLELEVDEPATIKAMVERLQEEAGEKFVNNFLNDDGTFKGSIVLLVNGLNMHQVTKDIKDPYMLPLSEKDELAFIVPFGGG